MTNSCKNAPITTVCDYIARANDVGAKLPYWEIEQVVEALLSAHNSGKTIYAFGNGASAALASHLVCDLSKGTAMLGGRRMRLMSLCDNTSLMTAWANDTAYEFVFAEQLKNFVQPGAVAFAISGSGNSPNVLSALKTARENNAVTVGLTGFKGGKAKALCDICMVVPSDNMQIIEDMHAIVAHSIFTVLCARLRTPEAIAVMAE